MSGCFSSVPQEQPYSCSDSSGLAAAMMFSPAEFRRVHQHIRQFAFHDDGVQHSALHPFQQPPGIPNVDLDMRLALPVGIGTEPGQRKGKRSGRRNADLKRRRLLERLETLSDLHILRTLENDLVPEILPCLGHFHTFSVIVEQRTLVEMLQVLDVLGHRRLGQMEMLRRFGITLCFTQGQKRVHSII